MWALDGASPMSHVDFRKWACPFIVTISAMFMSILKMVSCHMSISRYVMSVFFLVSLGQRLPVDFKNWLCRRVEFSGSRSPRCDIIYVPSGPGWWRWGPMPQHVRKYGGEMSPLTKMTFIRLFLIAAEGVVVGCYIFLLPKHISI